MHRDRRPPASLLVSSGNGNRRRYAYLGVSFVMNVMLGTAYSWSVFDGPLRSAYGADQFTAMLPMAVALVMFSIGMTFCGGFVDRVGPRKVAIVGGILVSAGYMLSAFVAVSPWPIPTLIVTYGVVMGFGLGFAYNPPIPTAARWFPDRKGFATGIVVMGYGLSPLFTAPAATALIGAYGVAAAFLGLGIVFLVVLLPLGSLLKFPPAGYQAPPPKRQARQRAWEPMGDVERRVMLRRPAFWTAWLLYAVGTAGGFMIIGKAKPIAVDVGGVDALSVLATASVMVVAVFNSLGRPIFGRLADSVGPKPTLLLMFAILLGAMGLLSVSSWWPLLYAGMAITGIVFGGFLAVMPALTTRYFGTKNLGANYGVMFTGYGVGALVATFAIGPIYNAFHSYVPAFYVGILLSLSGLAVALLLRPPKPVAARVPPRAVPHV